MSLITGYITGQALSVSQHSLIYRAQRQSDGAPVILKTLRDTVSTPENRAWLRREYELTRSLAEVPGVIQVLGLEQHPTGWMLVLEDTGGDSLANLGLAGRLDLPTFLHLALELTRILGAVHQQQIIHKDINPHNIVYNPTTHELTLIDFGLATRLSRETPTFQSATDLEGTLRYLAPEQTGRMNRVVDYRSDFYSLGITLYELLTGSVPFTSDDALELVHSHIARPPTPPHIVQPSIPEALSAIVLKLLAKDADERYQSAYGLQADLDYCRHALKTTGTIEPFPLAQQDISDRFALPQHLYGREAEVATLLATFDHVAAGRSTLLLVAGAPGIGKTALVQEIYRPLTARRGTFISGKFDQMQRNSPYLAFVQAFHGLVGQLLTEPDPVLQQWRTWISDALGVHGQVVVEVLPDLELIIGAQPPVPELGPQEAQNRFLLVFQRFVRVFTRPEHPLVVFLDDLQWADSGSLTLLEQLLSSAAGGYLFVIGSYRDTEVPPGHPLWSTLAAIRQAGTDHQTLTLGPLNDAAVGALVQDTLHVDGATAQPLARLVAQKTGGNPFFLGEFLKVLAVEGLLTFEPVPGRWRWDLAAIRARQMTDNVVALLMEQMGRLPIATQQALQHAACIGSRFSLATLAAVRTQSSATTAQHLEPALLMGLIEPLSLGYQLMTLDVAGLADIIQAEYRFAHDRIQQAAYEQVPESERAAYHWRIGRLLLISTPTKQRQERLFDFIGQLDAGRALATAPERLELAHLNLEAGRKAQASAAFAAADTYLQVGLELLPPDSWDAHYPLALALHEAAAEAAYLMVNFAEMERLVDAVLAQARTVLDMVKAYEIRIEGAAIQARYPDAIQAGHALLGKLGFTLPDRLSEVEVAQALAEVDATLAGRPIEALYELPLLHDPTTQAISRTLISLLVPYYFSNPLELAIIVCKLVTLTITAGNSPTSPYVYAFYSIILNNLTQDTERAYQWATMSTSLIDHLQADAVRARTLYMFYLHMFHWKEALHRVPPMLLTIYQRALERGDLDFAGYSLSNHCLTRYLSGDPLVALTSDMESVQAQILLTKNWGALDLHKMLWQTVLNLQEHTDTPSVLHGRVFTIEERLPVYQQNQDVISILRAFFYKLSLAYLFDEPTARIDDVTVVEAYANHLNGVPHQGQIPFYTSLARLRLYPDAPAADQPALLAQVSANQQHLRHYAQHAPMNYQHKWHLVEAERCRVLGEMAAAREHYDQAIAGARTHAYIHEEALAYELAGRFHLARRQTDLAHFYLTNAHRAYAEWGATAKVQHLERHYPTLATPSPTSAHWQRTTSSQSTTAALDVASLIKASQALSSEVQLDALLARLLHVLLETAGADRGVLLLHREGEWRVEAEGRVGEAPTLHTGVPTPQAALPQSLLSYALRTGTPIVLDDAPTTGAFTQDAYIQQAQPRSVLALPLQQQGALSGLLYLENTQTSGAFTAERQEILTLLSGQVAISLENARLYTHLEDLVAERTQALQAVNAQLATALAELETIQTERAQMYQEIITSQRATLHELSTPLLPIADGVVLLPLIGAVDPKRVGLVMETLLTGVARYQARSAIVDITGITVIDTQVAHGILQAAQAVQLLGAQVILTGIQPQIAQTLVHLGADLQGLQTRGSLQAGIAAVLNRSRRGGGA